jgi:hypothetical protein
MNMRTGRTAVCSVVLWLGCVTIFLDAVAGQSENTASAIGVEAIKRVLTGQKQWKLYWDRGGVGRPRPGERTSDRTPSVTFEFMRLGRRLVARAERDEVHHAECEVEVTVKEDGFIFEGCWGSDKTMTYDPNDRETERCYGWHHRSETIIKALAEVMTEVMIVRPRCSRAGQVIE